MIIDSVGDLDFGGNEKLDGEVCILTREHSWDSIRIGAASPPLRTEKGWLLLYHGVGRDDHHYRAGAMLLDLADPKKVIGRSRYPLLEPEVMYEKIGDVNNVVFPCGAVVKDNRLLVYYGGADKVVGVAVGEVEEIVFGLLADGNDGL